MHQGDQKILDRAVRNTTEAKEERVRYAKHDIQLGESCAGKNLRSRRERILGRKRPYQEKVTSSPAVAPLRRGRSPNLIEKTPGRSISPFLFIILTDMAAT